MESTTQLEREFHAGVPSKFTLANNALRKESLNTAEGVDGVSKMPTIMDERICLATRKINVMMREDLQPKTTYGFFLGPRVRAFSSSGRLDDSEFGPVTIMLGIDRGVRKIQKHTARRAFFMSSCVFTC